MQSRKWTGTASSSVCYFSANTYVVEVMAETYITSKKLWLIEVKFIFSWQEQTQIILRYGTTVHTFIIKLP